MRLAVDPHENIVEVPTPFAGPPALDPLLSDLGRNFWNRTEVTKIGSSRGSHRHPVHEGGLQRFKARAELVARPLASKCVAISFNNFSPKIWSRLCRKPPHVWFSKEAFAPPELQNAISKTWKKTTSLQLQRRCHATQAQPFELAKTGVLTAKYARHPIQYSDEQERPNKPIGVESQKLSHEG